MATFYIGATGSDANDGSEALPWLNLAYAVQNSADTDTIVIKEGVAVQTSPVTGLNFDDRKIIGENIDPSKNIIDFAGLAFKDVSSLSNCEISRFTLQNIKNSTEGDPVFLTLRAALFDRMILRDIWVGGHLNTSLPRGGLFGFGLLTISNTIIQNIYWSLGSGGSTFLFGYDRQSGFINLQNVAIYSETNPPVGAVNLPRILAFNAAGSTVSVNFKNTIVSFKNTTGLAFAFNISGAVITSTNSCFYNVAYDQGGTTILETDPLFVDADNGDFRLRPQSPCIGTGTIS